MKKKKNNFGDILINIFIVVFILMDIYMVSILIYSKTSHNLEYKPYNSDDLYLVFYNECYTDNIYVLKKDIENLFGNPKYFFRFKNLPKGIGGRTLLVLRIIDISQSLDYVDFCFAFTHELVHLTNCTLNERYCNFTAFKILYESKNNYFKYVALHWLNNDICGRFTIEYSFAGWAEEYLNNINKN